jgi:hypothetical protein
MLLGVLTAGFSSALSLLFLDINILEFFLLNEHKKNLLPFEVTEVA